MGKALSSILALYSCNNNNVFLYTINIIKKFFLFNPSVGCFRGCINYKYRISENNKINELRVVLLHPVSEKFSEASINW
jgi:hypothetical protein